ncbi:MAG: beta-propeller domain-containing protein [Clostridiales Family XIII bacterium]|jgi:uncharacterized secreted protein with C-terminal beta-propeller domain|nr:beta-propeller domain-containing protein [Clostridiales Family XIII bacterium]
MKDIREEEQKNTIPEKEFSDTVKRAMRGPGLSFYHDMNTEVPPAEMFSAGRPAQTARPAYKTKRRRFYAAISVAACAVIVCGLVLANGPLSRHGGTALLDSGADKASEVAAVNWSAADKDYANLYDELSALIVDRWTVGALGGLDGGVLYNEEESAADVSGGRDQDMAAAPNADSDEVPNADISQGGTGDTDTDTAGAPQNGMPVEDGDTAADEEDEGEEYSDTNNQVAGVQEADVIKTDGEYIYAINSQNLVIARANKGRPEVLAKIPQAAEEDGGQVYFEMYVEGDRLIAIRHGYGAEAPAASPGSPSARIAYPGGVSKTDTTADIYDISDRSNPRRIHSLSQSGAYTDSRMTGGILYLISSYSEIDFAAAEKSDPATYVPLYARDDEQSMAQPGDIMLPPNPDYASYTNISGIDALSSGDFISRKSFFGSTDIVYASTENIYLTSVRYNTEKTGENEKYNLFASWTDTTLTRVSLSGGAVEIVASAKVPGLINDRFSLDEYGGVLRVVTTDNRQTWADFKIPPTTWNEDTWADMPSGESKTSNGLYTLDGGLNVLGRVTDLAPGESVYSCRFMGDIAYFVTFRQTDPLFSVDVSDPAAPKVIGALKIPGFSEYLHPYADGLLFGLGKDADENTGRTGSLKLSMFNNSNPADVSEQHKLLLDGVFYSSAEYNHKAILVDARKSLIAFPSEDSYLIYSYDAASGFSKTAQIDIDRAASDDYNYIEIRGLFIEDVFYVVSPNSIKAYDMANGFSAIGSVIFNEGAHSVYQYDYGIVTPFAVEVIE